MVTSIGGLNERWARIAALQPPSAVQPGSGGGRGFGNGGTITTDLPPISPVAGSTASPLSNDTNFLLTVFGGGSQAYTRANAPTAPFRQDPASASAQLQPDAQLRLSVPKVNAAADGITGSTLVQELQALVSGGGRRTSAHSSSVPAQSSVPTQSSAPAPSSVPTPPAGPPNGSDAIGNTDTVVPSWHNGWDNTVVPNDRGRQVGIATYAAGDLSGQVSGNASVPRGFTA